MRVRNLRAIINLACFLMISAMFTAGFIFRSTLMSCCVKLNDGISRKDNTDTHKISRRPGKSMMNTNNCMESFKNTDAKEVQENDIHLRFEKRREHLHNVCKKRNNPLHDKICIQKGVANNLKYVENRQMLYCAIEKTGSTFWKRILHIAGGWRNVSNPTHIGLGEAYTEKGGYRSMKGKNWTNIVDVFSHARSVLFVRDPYTRLFSGWLDKFYSPNTYYWKSAGKQIVKTQRNTDVKCGYDVTFAEFVNYTVQNVVSSPCIDGHFQSNYLHCLSCSVSYDYIGKYETIKEDTIHLLDVFKLSEKIKFDDFEKDAALDAIKDAAGWVFSQKKEVDKCEVPFGCALFRVWSRLQSRGIISYKTDFPYKGNQDVHNLTKQQFEIALTNAYDASDLEDLKDSRPTALVQALSSLPKSSVTLIQQAFDLDFTIFEYDRSPVVPVDPTNLHAFDYFQACLPYLA